MDLLNNWLVQVFIGNIAWIVFCKIIKWLHLKLKSSNKSSLMRKNFQNDL